MACARGDRDDVVECYWPGITTEQAEQALATIGYCRGEVSAPTRVHPLGCILVPSDGMAFFLIIGPSEARIREAGEVIELPFDRIVESVPIVLRNELAVRRRSESLVVSRVASGKPGSGRRGIRAHSATRSVTH